MNPAQLYRHLGANPVINAAGYQTVLGGSRLSPPVQEAMAAANRHYVEMEKLLLSTGEEIAGLLGCEAAMVTPGCGAALALASAACMSAGNPQRMEQLPDTTGIPNEFLLQARQHYHYQRCLTIFGGVLVDAGDETGTSAGQLDGAVSQNTAAVHYFASGDEDDSILDLEGIFSVAAPRRLPVTVDAAYQVYPLETMRDLASSGGLVGFGAKYIGAPNSTGILCGPRELLEAAFLHSFIGFETSDYETLGRPLKLDRQEIVAVIVALREWLAMDHDARIAEHWVRADRIIDGLDGVRHVEAARHVEENSLSNGVMVTLDEQALGKTAGQVVAALKEEDPGIWTRRYGARIRVAVAHLIEDEVDTVIARLRHHLRG